MESREFSGHGEKRKLVFHFQQQAQGPKTPRPIRSERTEWVRTWYALGTLLYGLGYYGGIRTMYGVSTEWVRTEGGWDENIGLNRRRINF